MPSLPLVDTHLHVWDPNHLRYPWLDAIPLLNKPYLLADYDAACGDVPVAQMVFVQAEADFAQFREETAWVTELARQDPRLAGIVSWAPLERGDAVRVDLERL
ncbi:MAG: amidohydrolase family protein, partial [Anaerolineae bacterium]